jgi:hypothetical protein
VNSFLPRAFVSLHRSHIECLGLQHSIPYSHAPSIFRVINKLVLDFTQWPPLPFCCTATLSTMNHSNIFLSQFSKGIGITSHRGQYKQARTPTHPRKPTTHDCCPRIRLACLPLQERNRSGLPTHFDQQTAHDRSTHIQLAALCLKIEASRCPLHTTATANLSACGEM